MALSGKPKDELARPALQAQISGTGLRSRGRLWLVVNYRKGFGLARPVLLFCVSPGAIAALEAGRQGQLDSATGPQAVKYKSLA